MSKQTYKCTGCDQSLDRDKFYTRSNKNGINQPCKECMKAMRNKPIITEVYDKNEFRQFYKFQ